MTAFQKAGILMMSGTNPRPEFMSQLKTFCKNLEGEVKHLDLEVRAALLQDKVMKGSLNLTSVMIFGF